MSGEGTIPVYGFRPAPADAANSMPRALTMVPQLYAVLANYDLMIEALNERRIERSISFAELDAAGKLPDGYASKAFGGSQTKRLGWKSLFNIVRPLGLRIVFEIDEEAALEADATMNKRHDSQVRANNYAHPPRMPIMIRVFKHIARRGAMATNRKLTKKQRSANAQKAANARWFRILQAAKITCQTQGSSIMSRHRIPEKFTRLQDFGADLQGYGAKQTTHVRALKGSTFGPASRGRRLSEAERKAVEQRMRDEGKL